MTTPAGSQGDDGLGDRQGDGLSEGLGVPGPGAQALLALAFVAELAMLAGLFWAGRSLGSGGPISWVLGFLFGGAVSLVWGRWCAPRARTRLRNPWHALLKSLLFAVSLPVDRDAEV